jgi:hypothetical protein
MELEEIKTELELIISRLDKLFDKVLEAKNKEYHETVTKTIETTTLKGE